MPNSNVILVICLTVLIGLGVPAMLYAGLRRKGEIGQIELLRKATQRSQKPWQPEDNQLMELAERVEKLKRQKKT